MTATNRGKQSATSIVVLSTGRTGTTLLSQILSAAAGRSVPHQTRGSRAANLLGNFVDAGFISNDAAQRIATRVLGVDPNASTADPLKAMLIAQRLLERGIDPQTRVIHLVRDARDFVASFMSWKRQSLKRQFLHHGVPLWQPSPWLSGETSLFRWVGMSKFEHFSWVWAYKNELFARLSGQRNYLLVRTEDLVDPARRDASVAALCDFLHLTRRSESPPVAARVVNASDSSFPNWTQWSPEMSATLCHHCSELMQRFGYGAEPKWIELVTRGKTLAESKGGG